MRALGHRTTHNVSTKPHHARPLGTFDHLGIVSLRPGGLLHAVTYTTNYHYDRSWYLGHLWSLAVEEQFYMLWPALLLLLGRGRGLALAALFVVAAPFVRIATLKLGLGPQAGIGESFQTVGDSIAAGCLLAGFRKRLEASTLYMKLLDSPAFVLVPATAVACAFVPYTSVDLLVGMTVQNLAIAATVHHAIRHHESMVGRFLNARVPVYIGTLSYSLYLWQQIFLHHGEKSALDTPAPLNLAIATAAALVSFYVIEQPCSRWRERLEPHLFPKRVPA